MVKKIQLEKPIIEKQTQLSKKFSELVLAQLPIHQWEAKQKRKF